MPSKLSSPCGTPADELRQLGHLVFAHVTIDVLRQFLDLELAAEPLAEKRDVVTDDGADVEQRRLRMRTQRRQEFFQRLGGVCGCLAGASVCFRIILAPT